MSESEIQVIRSLEEYHKSDILQEIKEGNHGCFVNCLLYKVIHLLEVKETNDRSGIPKDENADWINNLDKGFGHG